MRLAVLAACLLLGGCESSAERELKRLQAEQLRLQIQAQTEQARLAAERAEQERQSLAEERRAEAERKAREAEQRAAEQRAEAERQQREAVDRYVQARALARVAAIVGPLRGDDPGIVVRTHNAVAEDGPFEASVKVNYRGGISGDALSFSGRLLRSADGKERFKYDPLPPQILGRLAFIGVQERVLNLLAAGDAEIGF